MSNRPHDLLEPFTYWKFAVKTVGIYVFAVTAFVALAEVSDKIKHYETELRHQSLGVLVSFIVFTYLHLLYHFWLRYQRSQLESKRSSPTITRRRANAKGKRKQARRNRRRRR